ncbi:efflux RND transporter periplasmic adaptor subunit [Rhizobium sp. C4]|uniref:efflux RND transporter periplasmic adaptor subunit n=1 Tax=Rhizobium sp. C4 TaxID=1349800 RepID=UPI001E5E8BE2|nr:efflux RND transporter periplasmic adaptor subunit [Rhizobium sp. C4]MCD2171874.1 efflux RND transporter periplasmic adaptor subunit [Rhizobium sp. C4]
MRSFWTILIILCCLGGAGYYYRAELVPYLPPQVAAYLPQAKPDSAEKSADASGKPGDAGKSADAGKGKGGQSGKRGGGGPTTVKVVEAKAGDLPMLRDSFGFIAARDTTSLASPIAGVVTEVKVQNGAEVKAGDILVTYDTRSQEATLAKDKATLAKDQSIYDNAKITLDRAMSLGEKGAATQQSTDNANAAFQQAQAALALDRAQILADQVAISNAQIVAPYDGKLGVISVSKGAYVAAGTAVGTIVDNKNVYAVFTLSEADLRVSREALAKNELTVSVRPTNASDGTQSVSVPVSFIDNAVDQTSGSFRLWAMIDNSSKAFWPGESVSARATVGIAHDLVLVPNVAIAPQQNGMIAYVVGDDNKVQVRQVKVSFRSDGIAGVKEGLKAGDKVVIEGQQSLSNGAAVKIDDGTAKPAGDKPKGAGGKNKDKQSSAADKSASAADLAQAN